MQTVLIKGVLILAYKDSGQLHLWILEGREINIKTSRWMLKSENIHLWVKYLEIMAGERVERSGIAA